MFVCTHKGSDFLSLSHVHFDLAHQGNRCWHLEYVFMDFDLDTAEFTQVQIKDELLVQNLEDMQDRQHIKGDAIDFEGYNPKKVILEQFR